MLMRLAAGASVVNFTPVNPHSLPFLWIQRDSNLGSADYESVSAVVLTALPSGCLRVDHLHRKLHEVWRIRPVTTC